MLFKSRFWPGIADGAITVTFRRWKRPQAVAGHVYRTPGGRIVVDSVAVVEAGTISEAEARMAGYETAGALAADLRGDAASPVYRVAFHLLDEPDPREDVAAANVISPGEFEGIRARLARWDRPSSPGPWTLATLQLIAAQPGGERVTWRRCWAETHPGSSWT